MTIDKDKVVSLAQALLNGYKNGEIDTAVYFEGVWKGLDEALSPPPPRPSKEKCIDWLNRYFTDGEVTEDSAPMYKAIIQHLKEPSLQWVKNTGVRPEYKICVVRKGSGSIEISRYISEYIWRLGDLENNNLDILEYIILE